MRTSRPVPAVGLAALALVAIAVGAPAEQRPYDDRLTPVASSAPSSGIKVPSPIATTSWAPGRVDVFFRGTADTLEQATYVSGHGWSRGSLGGRLASGPAVVATEVGRLHVFVRGSDGAVWTKRFEASRWSGWSSLGGTALGEPSVVSTGAGRLDVFARFGDNGLHHRALRNGAWSPWAALGGELTSPPAAATTGGERLTVFVRGADDAVWEKTYDGAQWQPFALVGGAATSSPAAASHADGTVDLYVRGTNSALYHRALSAGRYSPWTNLGGTLASGAAATSWSPGHRVVFVVGTDGRIYHRSFSAGRWTGFAAAPFGGVTRTFEEPLAPGVTFRSVFDPAGPFAIQVVEVALSAASTLDTALGTSELAGLERTSSIAARHDALVAINGDFALSSGRPVHAFAEDGRLLQGDQTPGRNFAVNAAETASYVGFSKPAVSVTLPTGLVQPIAKVNSAGPGYDDVIEFTPEAGTLEQPSGNGCSARLRVLSAPRLDSFGRVEQTQAVEHVSCDGAPLPPGSGDVLSAAAGGSKESFIRSLTPGMQLTHRWSLGWAGVTDSLGGNPTLLENGAIAPSVYGSGSFFARNPRTAVATAPGKVFLVVVDGRQPGHSAGMTLQELATYLQGLGARDALNLDGGGSSTMVVNGVVTNRPSDASERGVANALLLHRGPDTSTPTGVLGSGGRSGTTSLDRFDAAAPDARLHDPASTGGYADALLRQGVAVSDELARAADAFRARTRG